MLWASVVSVVSVVSGVLGMVCVAADVVGTIVSVLYVMGDRDERVGSTRWSWRGQDWPLYGVEWGWWGWLLIVHIIWRRGDGGRCDRKRWVVHLLISQTA